MARTAAVIGGGISGLASACRLAARGEAVTLFESEDFLGGLGTTFPYRDNHLERFYHCILPDDAALVDWIRELGLESELMWRPTAMGFMYQNRVFPMNTAMDLLRFSPLTVLERVRMGWMGLKARSLGTAPALDNISAADWIRGMIGERAFNILWKPLLSAKIGDHYPALPALWLTSRMSREKSSQQEVKGCLKRGYKSLIEAFERRLRERGATIEFKTRIRTIERDGERMAVVREDGKRQTFDTVISTSPLIQFQRMTAELALPAKLAGLQLDYQGVVCGVFLTREPLTHYYWMPWVDSGATAQGAIEMSNLVPLERSGGLHVNYLVNYTHRDSELFRKSDDETFAIYRADLRRLYPKAADSIVDQFVFRAPFVEPIWTVGYHSLRPSPSVIPGRLYLACTAQVYPRVNSWNSCCEVVNEMMKRYEEELPAAPKSV
ncbi:MAG: FAD-dependent oxidoreductase [Candidatus Eisenbacteria bacterium]